MLLRQSSHLPLTFFRNLSHPSDSREQIKIRKIVYNVKQYGDHIYRQYMKSMRKESKSRGTIQLCKQDNCLQLDNTLKLLKNFIKKSVLNYHAGQLAPGKSDDCINSDKSKAECRDQIGQFKVQTRL